MAPVVLINVSDVNQQIPNMTTTAINNRKRIMLIILAKEKFTKKNEW